MVPKIVEQVKLEISKPVEHPEQTEEASGPKVQIRRRRRTRAEIEAEMAAEANEKQDESEIANA